MEQVYKTTRGYRMPLKKDKKGGGTNARQKQTLNVFFPLF
jgi:hypothetical protein